MRTNSAQEIAAPQKAAQNGIVYQQNNFIDDDSSADHMGIRARIKRRTPAPSKNDEKSRLGEDYNNETERNYENDDTAIM